MLCWGKKKVGKIRAGLGVSRLSCCSLNGNFPCICISNTSPPLGGGAKKRRHNKHAAPHSPRQALAMAKSWEKYTSNVQKAKPTLVVVVIICAVLATAA